MELFYISTFVYIYIYDFYFLGIWERKPKAGLRREKSMENL
jgi:hypothetical protein